MALRSQSAFDFVILLVSLHWMGKPNLVIYSMRAKDGTQVSACFQFCHSSVSLHWMEKKLVIYSVCA